MMTAAEAIMESKVGQGRGLFEVPMSSIPSITWRCFILLSRSPLSNVALFPLPKIGLKSWSRMIYGVYYRHSKFGISNWHYILGIGARPL